MRKTNQRVQIGRISVDVPALLCLKHHCDPALCRNQACCCQCYEITFTRREMEIAAGVLPDCARYARHLMDDGELANPFEELPEGLYTVDENGEEGCAFSFRDARKRTWCAIHAAALDLGLSPWKTKPKMCTLWPLALSEGRRPVLTIDATAYRFPCNARRRNARRLDAGVQTCVDGVFGPRFLKRLNTAIDLLYDQDGSAHERVDA